MAVNIQLKYSSTENSAPSASDFSDVGILAVNAHTNSPAIYMKDSGGSVVKMAGVGSITTPAASDSVAGISEYATNAETTTGTATDRSVTPAGLAAVTSAERTTSDTNYLAKSGGTLTGVLAATAGTAAAPSIHFSDTDSGIYGGTNTVALTSAGAATLTSLSTGYIQVANRLGIGIAPDTALQIKGAGELVRFSDANDAGYFSALTHNDGQFVISADLTNTASNSEIRFQVDGSDAARFDAGQRLLLGPTTARTLYQSQNSKLQIEGTDISTSSLSILTNQNNTNPAILSLGKTRGTAVGATTTVQQNDELGQLLFQGSDGTNLLIGAKIAALVDGEPGTGADTSDMPGRLAFYTTPDGSDTPAERITIKNSGVVGINNTNPIYTLDIGGHTKAWTYEATTSIQAPMIEIDASTYGYIDFKDNSTGSENYDVRIKQGTTNGLDIDVGGSGNTILRGLTIDGDGSVNAGGAVAESNRSSLHGAVNATGYSSRTGSTGGSFTGNLFNIAWVNGNTPKLYIDTTDLGTISLTSDYRVKQNVETQTASGIDRVKQLRPVTYDFADYGTLFKADGVTREGFIAHELAEVIPSGCEGEKDKEDSLQSLRIDAIVSVLTKAVQELAVKVEALEAK